MRERAAEGSKEAVSCHEHNSLAAAAAADRVELSLRLARVLHDLQTQPHPSDAVLTLPVNR